MIENNVDYSITLDELQKYDDKELCRLEMYADRDRATDFYAAECVYWMCIMEISRRSDEEEDVDPVESMSVKAIANLYNNDHEFIFRYGDVYQMFIIDATILIFTDKWVPHVFSIEEDHDRCVWKYFGMTKEMNNAINN